IIFVVVELVLVVVVDILIIVFVVEIIVEGLILEVVISALGRQRKIRRPELGRHCSILLAEHTGEIQRRKTSVTPFDYVNWKCVRASPRVTIAFDRTCRGTVFGGARFS